MELIIALIAGVLGGNGAAKAKPQFDMGALLNSVVGALGGVGGGLLLSQLGLGGDAAPLVEGAEATSGGGLGAILSGVIGGGAGGAIVTAVIAMIKNRAA